MSAVHRAIYGERRRLGLDDDSARDLYARVTGKTGLTLMSPAEHEKVLAELRRQNGASTPDRKGLQGPFAKKLQALWIAGWNLGLVRDRTDAALLAFVERQTGISHTRFLIGEADARKAVEALKSWTARAGVDWTDNDLMPAWQRQAGAKIALAQWAILHPEPPPLDPDAGFLGFKAFVEDHAFNPLPRMTAREWQGVMNTLGSRIRKVRKP